MRFTANATLGIRDSHRAGTKPGLLSGCADLGTTDKEHLNYLLAFDRVIASRGGIPLIEGGKIIGAIGCSGGTDSQGSCGKVVCYH